MLILPETYVRYLEQLFGADLFYGDARWVKPYIPAIRHLSEHLTKPNQRQEFTDQPYLEDQSLRKAYQLYYTTANLLKLHILLDETALSGFFQNKKQLSVLDVGSGTGTMILALLTWLSEHQPDCRADITALDHSPRTLHELQYNLNRFWNFHIDIQIHDLQTPVLRDRKYDLILAGNVLNEINSSARALALQSLFDLLSPGGFMICIEPALKEASRTLLEFRDQWITHGGFVYSPCCTRQPCPALTHPDDWCHHDVPWQRPSFMEYIDESIGLIKKTLKFTYMIFSRTDNHVLDYLTARRDFNSGFRVVSELLNEKGRLRAYCCNDHGRVMFEKNKRDDSVLNHPFNHICRYDMIEMNRWTEKKQINKIEVDSEIKILNKINV